MLYLIPAIITIVVSFIFLKFNYKHNSKVTHVLDEQTQTKISYPAEATNENSGWQAEITTKVKSIENTVKYFEEDIKQIAMNQIIQHSILDNVNQLLPNSLQSCIKAMQQLVHIAQSTQDTSENTAKLLKKLYNYNTNTLHTINLRTRQDTITLKMHSDLLNKLDTKIQEL